MSVDGTGLDLEVSRRRLLLAAGLGSGAIVAASLTRGSEARAAAPSGPASDPAGAPAVAGLHLQFGSDASSEVTVSWHALQPVERPRVVLGRLDGRLEQTTDARATSYTDAKAGQVVIAYHATLRGLQPETAYLYAALHEGAEPEFGTFRTAPRGRAAFTFTSFGDQGTPTLGRSIEPPAGSGLHGPLFVNDNLGSPAAGDTTLGVERLRPLFHLFTATSATPTWPRTG